MVKKEGQNKKLLNKKNTIMIVILALVLVLVPIGVGAWFVLSQNAGVDMFGGTISKWDLIVSDTPGGPQLTEDDFLKLSVDEFTNVNSGVMAPGTYGTIDLYVRTTTDAITEYAIYVDKTALSLNIYDSSLGTSKDEQIKANSDMLKKHIRFYTDESMTKEVNMDEPIVGSISPNKEVKATIYWKWLYDGSNDVPANLTNAADVRNFLREWDLEDCFISENREHLEGNLRIYVSAFQEEPDKQ